MRPPTTPPRRARGAPLFPSSRSSEPYGKFKALAYSFVIRRLDSAVPLRCRWRRLNGQGAWRIDRLAHLRQRFRFALLVAGLIGSPGLVAAEDGLSRDEAKQKLDQTEQSLQSNRAKEQGLAQELATLAEERAKQNPG